MQPLGAAALFTLWEHGRPLTPTGRCRATLRAAGIPAETVDQLSVGQGDALLMELRARMFGTKITSVVGCPDCGERLDVVFDLDDVKAARSGDPADPVEVRAHGCRVLARPPTLADLSWLERCTPDADRRTVLLERCVVTSERDGVPVSAADLPAPVASRVSAALDEADPQAQIRLGLRCEACGRAWEALFDVGTYLWEELETWVWRTAEDVDALAARYGWSEAEILAMSPPRRELYLELGRT